MTQTKKVAVLMGSDSDWPVVKGACAELKRLGQLLHERFELEDCLIEVLHNAHRQQATATPL